MDELANPLTPVLAAGAGLSAAAGSPVDAAPVGGVMGSSALFSALYRRRTVASLRALVPAEESRVSVRRAGTVPTVAASELVLGDIIELEAGTVVPADLRLIEATALEVGESSLTGESLPVPRSPEPTPDAAVAERTLRPDVLRLRLHHEPRSARLLMQTTCSPVRWVRNRAKMGPWATWGRPELNFATAC